MTDIILIHFVEENAPYPDEPLTENILINRLYGFCLDSFYGNVAKIKEQADDGYSIGGFEIPLNYNDLSWNEKIELICRYLSEKTKTFEIIPVDALDLLIN